MGLKETFQNAAVSGFKAAGNLVHTVTYHSSGKPVVSHGTVTATELATVENVTAIFGRYSDLEVQNAQGRLQRTDIKCLIPGFLLGSLIPKPDDWLTEGSVVYNVVDFLPDPAGALYEFQVRP